MKILIVGSGAREHALCWKVASSPIVSDVYCAPGNPGIFSVARPAIDPKTGKPIAVDNINAFLDFARDNRIDLTIVGPELPLSLGIVDEFRSAGLRIFGPTRAAALIEYSKSFAKEVMTGAGVPTAKSSEATDSDATREAARKFGFPVVIKADGLAAGKGVFICHNDQELNAGIAQVFGTLKQTRVVVEEFLEGIEVSFIVATDGERVVPFPLSNDYKRLCDGDAGPNTGGMGCLSPTPRLSDSSSDELISLVIEPVLNELARRGAPYTGFLYAGLMIGRDGKPYVLEYNARMGDPECQALMRRTESDIVPVLAELAGAARSSATEDQAGLKFNFSTEQVVLVVLAAKGYPDNVEKGDQIEGIEFADSLPGIEVFHAGTSRDSSGNVVTDGGRVLSVTATGKNLKESVSSAYRASDMIQFRGRQLRRDIGAK